GFIVDAARARIGRIRPEELLVRGERQPAADHWPIAASDETASTCDVDHFNCVMPVSPARPLALVGYENPSRYRSGGECIRAPDGGACFDRAGLQVKDLEPAAGQREPCLAAVPAERD